MHVKIFTTDVAFLLVSTNAKLVFSGLKYLIGPNMAH